MNSTTIIIIIVVAILTLIILGALLSSRSSGDEEWKLKIKSELKRISGIPTSPQKLIELDKLMDFYLKNSKVKGETMGERLKNARNNFSKSDYNNIWEAHKLRNRLVHEVGITYIKSELDTTIKNFRDVISKL